MYVSSVTTAQHEGEHAGEDILMAVDRAVDLMCHVPQYVSKMQHLLALRHEYLDEVFYSTTQEAGGEALLRPRVFLCTVPVLAEPPRQS